jgi:hypothetical protein
MEGQEAHQEYCRPVAECVCRNGYAQTLKSLEAGAVETLIVYEDFPMVRWRLVDPTGGTNSLPLSCLSLLILRAREVLTLWVEEQIEPTKDPTDVSPWIVTIPAKN